MKTNSDKFEPSKHSVNTTMKVNFVGGMLKLKNQKNDSSMAKLKKVISKDIIKEKEKFPNEEIIGFLNNDEEKYVRTLEEQIEHTNKLKDNYDTRTAAEKAFQERKLKRLPEKILKDLQTNYKQKYEHFNKSLSKLPEHYDIPKVGPG